MAGRVTVSHNEVRVRGINKFNAKKNLPDKHREKFSGNVEFTKVRHQPTVYGGCGLVLLLSIAPQ